MAQLIKKADTTHTIEHDVSSFTEYPFESTGLSLGISEIRGRYPAAGFDVDTAIEQIWYVLDGSGSVRVETTTYHLQAGDMLHIAKGEKYIIDGQLKLMVASVPGWTAAQHQHTA